MVTFLTPYKLILQPVYAYGLQFVENDEELCSSGEIIYSYSAGMVDTDTDS
jgi:hypothetical protein